MIERAIEEPGLGQERPVDASEWSNWQIVLGGLLGTAVGAAPTMVVSFGIFLKPVSAEFGWDRSVLSSGLLLAVMLNAIMTPVLGWLIDRHGVRRVTLTMIALFSLATAAMSQLTSSYAMLVLLFAAWGITSAGQSQVPYVTAISTSFTRHRGVALGIGLCGLGIGTSLIPPVARWLLDLWGWRYAYVGLGILCFVVAFTAVFALIDTPGKGPVRIDRAVDARRSSLAVFLELVRSRSFWSILLPVLFMSMATNGAVSNLVPILTDGGMPATTAASYAALVGISTIVGKVSSGFLVDRFPAPLVASGYFALPIIAFTLLVFDEASRFPVIVMISLGLALGSEVALAGTLVGRVFGLQHFGQIFGFTAFAFSAGVGLGSVVMNGAYDHFGSYRPALIGCGIALALAALVIGSVRENVRQTQSR